MTTKTVNGVIDDALAGFSRTHEAASVTVGEFCLPVSCSAARANAEVERAWSLLVERVREFRAAGE